MPRFDTARPGSGALVRQDNGRWLSFERPTAIVQAHDVNDVTAAIEHIEAETRAKGLHAVGLVSYEAGAAFGLTVSSAQRRLPLVWFALFQSSDVRERSSETQAEQYELGALTPSVDRPAFETAFARVRHHLAEGDTYQVNYTFRMEGVFSGHAAALFADLASAQEGLYSTFLDLGDVAICSASPELFFERIGSLLVTRPMKGTAPRGRTLDEDRRQAQQLLASPKQRAENVMIVDMMRNDLGRVAVAGSVEVPALLTVERYPNVWQMTSTVTARTAEGTRLSQIFAALHPSASVTGAPKVRTMELVEELERQPRGVYTGAIGHVRPDGSARFSVAIRTAVVDRRAGRVEFGIGSGIVWDSVAADEYDECLLKGSVLGERPRPFDLLETMRWAPGEGIFLLDRHLSRLRASAEYFGTVIDEASLERALAEAQGNAPLRLRLLVGRDGRSRLERSPLVPAPEVLRVGIAASAVDDRDRFLFHKTTNRSTYERAQRPGFDDMILWNERGQATESTKANLVVERGGRRVTPPVDAGLLAGTFRAEVLSTGEVQEGTVMLDELRRAERVWLINSVRGWQRAIIQVR